MSEFVLLSAIVPTFNESSHIEKLILDYLKFAPAYSEIFIVDGGSTDGTLEIVNRVSQDDKRINVLINKKKYVSFAFNLAFENTKGKYVALLGAHSEYCSEYFNLAIKSLELEEADVVGGILEHSGKSLVGKAIAFGMSSVFGVGNTPFRTENKRMYVDSVAFAIYKREIFKKVGLLDERLIRNQDDELHYRLNHAGFRILMLPELKVNYFVRETFSKLFKQYYQYGLYKPMVIRKVRSGFRFRHLLPSLFVLYILSLPLVFFSFYWSIPLFFYFTLSFYFSLSAKANWRIRLYIPIVFPVLHIAYGSGFLMGLFKN